MSSFASAAPEAELARAQELLQNGGGAGAEYTGWVGLPEKAAASDEYARIKAAAKRIADSSQALVVVGIGGSYLGARAVIEGLLSPNYNLLKRGFPQVFFAGNGLSSDALSELEQLLDGKDFSINVVSKSGTTTEPAVAFRFLRNLCEARYGRDGAKSRIFATTDARRGALRSIADAEGYETFVIPDDVGGRYSVLTPVGLLPIAAAGIDTDALLSGAAGMAHLCAGGDSPAHVYAAARTALYRAGKSVELLAFYEPALRFMGEWWKQLFGESEGKEHKGLFPASCEFTADLHSMGQYIQDGQRLMFETVVRFDEPRRVMTVPHSDDEGDGLAFLEGKPLSWVCRQAMDGTYMAHTEGGVPNIAVSAEKREAYELGELIYFFEYACGLSGYMLGVNPFDQPGVEAYKKNMFALLGKPGYGERRAELLEKLGKQRF
jgi:glucose-6-phosphate isomerase